jgi:NAD+ kinase
VKRIGVIGHLGYAGLPAVLERLLEIAPTLGLTLALDQELYEAAGKRGELLGSPESLDAMMTLGGDGTFLRGARYVGGRAVPVLGINFGRLGFLTACSATEFEDGLRRLASGDFVAEPRMALSSSAMDAGGDERCRWLALNDVVLHKGGLARLVRFTVLVNGEQIGCYSADGLIVSTPTGSTGYSLSAGGPIVVPTLESLVITPVSPHTLAIRPLVLPPDVDVTVRADDGPGGILVTVDGQVGTTFTGGEALIVRRAPTPVHVVRFRDTTYFATLRNKLGWGGLSERDGQST